MNGAIYVKSKNGQKGACGATHYAFLLDLAGGFTKTQPVQHNSWTFLYVSLTHFSAGDFPLPKNWWVFVAVVICLDFFIRSQQNLFKPPGTCFLLRKRSPKQHLINLRFGGYWCLLYLFPFPPQCFFKCSTSI